MALLNFFLDDERDPPDDGQVWVVARSYDEAVRLLEESRQCPSFISFDHDLGLEETGLDFAKWLIDKDLDYSYEFIPQNFRWFVHSQNPIGAKNINDLLKSYLSFRR